MDTKAIATYYLGGLAFYGPRLIRYTVSAYVAWVALWTCMGFVGGLIYPLMLSNAAERFRMTSGMDAVSFALHGSARMFNFAVRAPLIPLRYVWRLCRRRL